MNKVLKKYGIYIVVSFLLSCSGNTIYEQHIDIPDGIWNYQNKLLFEPEIEDTINSYSINIHVRHTNLYPYSNLYLFVNTTAPTGASIRDTFECTLADEKGKWLGNGLGDIWDSEFVFKSPVRFPYAGTYQFEIEQAMRREKLPFIMDCGFSIKNYQPDN